MVGFSLFAYHKFSMMFIAYGVGNSSMGSKGMRVLDLKVGWRV